ncbi:TlpA disulfide reductase family protein [Amycolatopsis sp. QT-25]|uniref:TlpA family protein disulfide reductase n=1 Tax=Amycolatopsis sp. QT-25 TaxID=3034022 RepID=UPI0023ED85C0|nr:TlpA disulfide reductase family protein [Amycolatopsis sp. QT-25]WET76526.1 TlpA disulfide reductase family protein [Amycolatopsis sp. QT-25]
MPYLTAGLILVGLIGVTNLLFTFGVIRRLREHTTLLARGVGSEPMLVMRAAGEFTDDFTVTTVDGDQVGRDLVTKRTLVGFFTPTCPSCREQLPDFTAFAEGWSGGRRQVLAVVVSSDDAAAVPIVEALMPVARVVREDDGGVLTSAFGVRGFPAFAVLDAGGALHVSGSALAAVSDVANTATA